MVSRRVHTRDSLRRVKRCYHPNGNFVDEKHRNFDFIFEEFARDPSLPVKMIPSAGEIEVSMDVDLICRHRRIKVNLVPITFIFPFKDKPFKLVADYDHNLLQECCDAWNEED